MGATAAELKRDEAEKKARREAKLGAFTTNEQGKRVRVGPNRAKGGGNVQDVNPNTQRPGYGGASNWDLDKHINGTEGG